MSRHQQHQQLTAVGACAPRASGSNSSGTGGADDATTVAYDELQLDRDLPRGRVQGRLKMLFKQRPDQLDFAVKAKLTVSSSYVQQSKKQHKTVMVRFVLLPSPSDGPSTTVGSVLDSNYALLRQSLGSTVSVDCSGARVGSQRTMNDGTTEVLLRASGSRTVTIDGTAHEFLKYEQPKPKPDASGRSRAVADWFSPSPAPPTRPAVIQELTRADVTRPGGPSTGNLRPLSEVPQFILQSRARRTPTAPAHALSAVPADAARADQLATGAPPPLYAAATTPPAVPHPLTVAAPMAIATHPPEAPEAVGTSSGSSERTSKGGTDRITLKAELNLESQHDGRGTEVPGTAGDIMEGGYFPDQQLSAVEEEVKRRSAAAAAEAARRRQSDTKPAVSPFRPLAVSEPERPGAKTIASFSWQQEHEQRAEVDSEHAHAQHTGDKRRREEAEVDTHDQKKLRGDVHGAGGEPHRHSGATLAPLHRETAGTRASAEDAAIRKRQAQARAAQEERDRRTADSEQLRSSFQVHGRSVPRTYVTLREAASRGSANVTAVIIDIKGGIRTTSTGDRSLTIVVADPSSHTNGNASEDMVVTVFRKTEAPLAPLQVGMPILFRALKITTYNAKAKGSAFSNGQCTFHVLRNGEVVNCDESPEGLSPEEVERLTLLQQWWEDNGEHAPDRPQPVGSASDYANRGRTDRELGTVQEHQYFQLTGKILDMQLNTRGGNFPKYELYVSDGTISADDVRDFHGISQRYPWLPRGGLFTLAVQNDPVGRPFEPGQVVRFPNVRVKRYAGQLELIWSDKVTMQQERDGWRTKRHTVLPASDERAQAIEKRLKDWKRGRVPEGQAERGSAPLEAKPEPDEPEPAKQPVAIARHIATVYQDELAHQRSSIPEIRANLTVPNRFRTLARVRDVLGRGARGSLPRDLAVLWCGKCQRAFPDTHCRSCEDTAYKHASVRWQVVLLLEDEGGDEELVAVLAGKQADSLLPALPSVSTSSTPADIAKIRRTGIPGLRSKVEDILQGALFDGERTRPLIDLTLESYTQDVAGQAVVIWRLFGMQTTP